MKTIKKAPPVHPGVYELRSGAWEPTNRPVRDGARANFLICCKYGDWSGFRTLADCLKQIPTSWRQRPEGFYWIEER